MSDRPGTVPPDDDDNLDYLDAGLEDAGETTPLASTPVAPIAPPAPAPTIVMAPAPERDTSWYWPIANLVGLLVVIGVNYLANAWEFNGHTTGEVVNADPVPFQPAGWVFSIWGLIYVLLLVFTVYGLLPAGRHNARLQRISPLFLIANVANVAWIVLWHWEQFLGSLIAIVVLLAALLGIYVGLRARNPMRKSGPAVQPRFLTRLVLFAPFSIYLAWVVVASLANLMVWFDRAGRDGGPFSQNTWAVLLMVAATLVGALFALVARDVLVPLVLAVAFVGIAQHAWGESAFVSITAIVVAVVALGLAALAGVLSYERGSNQGASGWRTGSGTPPPMTPIE
jgi:hypothetical protein